MLFTTVLLKIFHPVSVEISHKLFTIIYRKRNILIVGEGWIKFLLTSVVLFLAMKIRRYELRRCFVPLKNGNKIPRETCNRLVSFGSFHFRLSLLWVTKQRLSFTVECTFCYSEGAYTSWHLFTCPQVATYQFILCTRAGSNVRGPLRGGTGNEISMSWRLLHRKAIKVSESTSIE